MASQSVLQMKKISKAFAGVPSLKSVSFEVRRGEIHSLLGANGAGKSTLMKILSGAYSKDHGEISIDGESAQISSPQHAKALGIQTVYQEVDTALIPALSVAENIFLDRKINRHAPIFMSWSKLYKEAEELLQQLRFSINVRRKVEELTLSEKQLVLIARAIAQEVKYIILDEPTAPLSIAESERLYELIYNLKESGVGIIFISHRLPEVFQLSDRITVLRDGEHICTKNAHQTNMQDIISYMLGKQLKEELPKKEVKIGHKLLEVNGIGRGTKVKEVQLSVSSGEIVGIFGLVGAGKTETTRLLFGADPMDRGQVMMEGNQLSYHEPYQAIKHGLVLVPEERRKEGILVNESVLTNLSLSTIKKWTSSLGFIKGRSEREVAHQMVQQLGIRSSSHQQKVGFLSGGNQQKVAIGKWLLSDAKVYLFDEPTKGVDIGAKKEIYELIGQLAQSGKGILYFSCEIAEILGLADTIYIMYEGQVSKVVSRAEATQELLMYYASGGTDHEL